MCFFENKPLSINICLSSISKTLFLDWNLFYYDDILCCPLALATYPSACWIPQHDAEMFKRHFSWNSFFSLFSNVTQPLPSWMSSGIHPSGTFVSHLGSMGCIQIVKSNWHQRCAHGRLAHVHTCYKHACMQKHACNVTIDIHFCLHFRCVSFENSIPCIQSICVCACACMCVCVGAPPKQLKSVLLWWHTVLHLSPLTQCLLGA